MSELINIRDSRTTIRWKLLTSASALALTAAILSVTVAKAEDSDRPLIWIDLGGQMENVSGQGEVFAPPFLAANPDSPVLGSVTPLQAQKPPRFSFDEDGKITFQPENSDWRFSAAIRYGRSGNTRHVQHQTDNTFYKYYHSGVGVQLDTKADFSDTHASRSERHLILDFTAGKDIGLGLLGEGASSTLNLGVRIAQFRSSATFDIRALPDMHIKYTYFPSYNAGYNLPYFNTYHATGRASRSFRGLGPSLSWSGSAPFVGNAQDGELTLDWGANVALLFGKQKARVQHHESKHYYGKLAGVISNDHQYALIYNHATPIPNRSRSVSVPNVGGSVGLSWRVQDFKVSLGYRYDTFLKAMDTGIDARKTSNLTFNGPYASISIGLGD